MHRFAPVVLSGLSAVLALAFDPASAAAVTWGVPGNGSNVCTVVNPNCNAIAQAVTASSSGDTISIGAGNFAVPASIALTKTLTITGAGIGVTFVQPASTAFSVRTNDIVFSDFTLQNGSTGIAFQGAASNNTQITRVQFSGQTARGIDVSLAATFPVTNVAITDCQFAVAAIAIRTSSTAQVAGMTIGGTSFTGGTYGLYVANDGNTSTFSGLTIQNSSFTNVGGAAQTYAIYAEEMRDVVIEDSTFAGGRSGVGLLKFYSTSGVAAANIAVRRNAFSGFTGNALDLEVYAGGATPGVGLENPITVEDNTIQKDVSIALSSAAIFVRLPPALTNAAVNIVGNDVVLSGTFGAATQAHAVQLRGNGPVVLTGNTLDGGNVGGTGTTPPSSGIFIQSQIAGSVMPATVTISASCNRIQGFRNGVSVFDSIANAYGGLQVGAAVSLTNNAILDNDDGVVTAAAPPTIDAESTYWGCPAGPTAPACDSVTGDVDADPFLAVIPACVACVANGECDDGLFCDGSESCGAGACVAGGGDPCLGGPACENLCDEAADNCLVPAGTVCRPAAGDCDAQETCTGLGGSCPADALVLAGTECRPAAGVCDAAESCDGIGIGCPADGFLNSGECRPAAGVCDSAESCDGGGINCPADAKSTAPCRAAADVCDVAESCDGISDDCPADALALNGTPCRADAGQCDVAEACTGLGAACPADAKEANGTPCDDGSTCTATDACQAGACVGADPLDCDDGNACTADSCTPLGGCVNDDTPASGCLTAGKSIVLIKESADDNKDKLLWKWLKGAELTQTDFADPTASAAYALCIYAGSASTLIADAALPPGADWKPLGSKGYKFKGSSPDGLTLALLKGGAAGKSKAIVKGKGAALPDPALPLSYPVTVQLKKVGSPLCMQSTFTSTDEKKNTSTQFKAKQ